MNTINDREDSAGFSDVEKSDPTLMQKQARNEYERTFWLDWLAETRETLKNRDAKKEELKAIFFWIIIILFVMITIAPYLLIFFFKDIITTTSLVTAIIASLVEIISAIMILPKIIAEYLFDKGEADNSLRLLENLNKNQNQY